MNATAVLVIGALSTATFDGSRQVLDALRENIVDLEFHYETYQGDPDGNDNKQKGNIKFSTGLIRVHRDGVFYHSLSTSRNGGRDVYEESTRLNGTYRIKSTFANPNLQPTQSVRAGNPVVAVAGNHPLLLWPQVQFMLSRDDPSFELTRGESRNIGGVATDLFECGKGVIHKYWLDLANGGALVEAQDFTGANRKLWRRIRSIVHTKVVDGKGGSITVPSYGVLDHYAPRTLDLKAENAATPQTRLTIAIVMNTLKVNVGRSADETEVKYKAGISVIDYRKPTAVPAKGDMPLPSGITQAALEDAAKNQPPIADVPRGQPASFGGWWWLLVGLLAGVGIALIVTRKRQNA